MRIKNKTLNSNFKTMQNKSGTTKTKKERWLIVQKVVIIRFNCESVFSHLRGSLSKTGPLRFGSENQFPLNFAHEYILVQM